MPEHTADRLMAGCPGVAPGYVDLESTRSHGDPHPISVWKFLIPIFASLQALFHALSNRVMPFVPS